MRLLREGHLSQTKDRQESRSQQAKSVDDQQKLSEGSAFSLTCIGVVSVGARRFPALRRVIIGIAKVSGDRRGHLIGEAAFLRPIPSRRHVEVGLARRHRLVHETGPKNGRCYQFVRSAGKRRAVQVIGEGGGRSYESARERARNPPAIGGTAVNGLDCYRVMLAHGSVRQAGG